MSDRLLKYEWFIFIPGELKISKVLNFKNFFLDHSLFLNNFVHLFQVADCTTNPIIYAVNFLRSTGTLLKVGWLCSSYGVLECGVGNFSGSFKTVEILEKLGCGSVKITDHNNG